MIDGLVRKMKKKLVWKPEWCLPERGFNRKKYLEEEVIYDRHLVMDGLRLVYNKNK